MKRHLAHALRRTARRLIGWSNRLDNPMVVTVYDKHWNKQACGSIADIERHLGAQFKIGPL
ncbi:hypothetical protein MHPYR_180072 [uncultured Mycobacterium sp.]|uniref:Uncharacterized protein n=1 Tax=uncultured Mycobacterium sp. TaxID=171292 RepID=A0A1Y5P8H1_9MYCO|nr:hypothetical protein MHPYR_180072 [uncultured Mycobacterium sp.]